MEKKEFYYDSRDGLTKIHAVEWLPEGRPVCILQIVHGMAEYIDRYHRLAVFLAEKGILVVGMIIWAMERAYIIRGMKSTPAAAIPTAISAARILQPRRLRMSTA